MRHYLPARLLTMQGGQPGEYAVIRSEAFPAGQHPARCPLIAACTAVRATLENGAVRWFGCDRAYIDSSLRMVLVNVCLGEVVKTWTVATEASWAERQAGARKDD